MLGKSSINKSVGHQNALASPQAVGLKIVGSGSTSNLFYKSATTTTNSSIANNNYNFSAFPGGQNKIQNISGESTSNQLDKNHFHIIQNNSCNLHSYHQIRSPVNADPEQPPVKIKIKQQQSNLDLKLFRNQNRLQTTSSYQSENLETPIELKFQNSGKNSVADWMTTRGLTRDCHESNYNNLNLNSNANLVGNKNQLDDVTNKKSTTIISANLIDQKSQNLNAAPPNTANSTQPINNNSNKDNSYKNLNILPQSENAIILNPQFERNSKNVNISVQGTQGNLQGNNGWVNSSRKILAQEQTEYLQTQQKKQEKQEKQQQHIKTEQKPNSLRQRINGTAYNRVDDNNCSTENNEFIDDDDNNGKNCENSELVTKKDKLKPQDFDNCLNQEEQDMFGGRMFWVLFLIVMYLNYFLTYVRKVFYDFLYFTHVPKI